MRPVNLKIGAWKDLCELSTHLSGFVFRGQSDAEWQLNTSVERAYEKYSPLIKRIEMSERWYLHEFKLKFNLYSQNPPAEFDYFEWLALLQHHGCPTRLLDFTKSIYVAYYFSASQAVSDCAVWCLSHWGLRDSIHKKFNLPYKKCEVLKDQVNEVHKELINKYIGVMGGHQTEPHLVPLESTRYSHRLARQQGMFLAPTHFGSLNESSGFAEAFRNSFPNLHKESTISLSELMSTKDPAREFAQIKITFPKSMLRVGLSQLSAIGLSDETLFPDLDGLSRSLVLKHIRQ